MTFTKYLQLLKYSHLSFLESQPQNISLLIEHYRKISVIITTKLMHHSRHKINL